MSDEKQLIESINWSKLKHAEGSAIDTGADLLALTSSQANERRDAFEVLALMKAAEPQKSMGLAESANHYRELAAQIAAADTPELAQRALVATLEREYNLKPAPTEVVAEFFAEHPKSARNVAKELATTWKDTPPSRLASRPTRAPLVAASCCSSRSSI